MTNVFAWPFTSTANNSIVSTSTVLALTGGVSVGTTSAPFATLYIAPGAGQNPLFDIASTTAALATTSLFRVNWNGIVTAPQFAFTNGTGTSLYASASSTFQILNVGSTFTIPSLTSG